MSRVKKYIPEFIYGSVDGTVTTFAVVAASVGAGLSSGVILVLGVANLLADGFSMGASAFLSAESDESKSKAKKRPIPIGSVTFSAFSIAGAMPLLAYVYEAMIGKANQVNPDLFPVSTILAIATFAVIGYIKARVEKRSLLVSIITTVSLGAIAAALAYFAGGWLGHLLGVGV